MVGYRGRARILGLALGVSGLFGGMGHAQVSDGELELAAFPGVGAVKALRPAETPAANEADPGSPLPVAVREPARPNVSKSIVEGPLEQVLEGSSPAEGLESGSGEGMAPAGESRPAPRPLLAAPERDFSKVAIELPAEALLGRSVPVEAAPPNPAMELPRRPASDSVRKVAPGSVHWHPDLETARARSSATGRPVLLFALLGKLDDAFC